MFQTRISNGFSLIELVFALLVFSTLFLLVQPSYQSLAAKSRIEDAKSRLLSLQIHVERYYLDHFVYPEVLSELPVYSVLELGEHEHFKFEISFDAEGCLNDRCYELIAQPKRRELENERLTIDSVGHKSGQW